MKFDKPMKKYSHVVPSQYGQTMRVVNTLILSYLKAARMNIETKELPQICFPLCPHYECHL